MRLNARYLSNSLFDFIENTKLGDRLFRLGRLAAFGLVLLVVGKFASGQFLSFRYQDVLFMAIAGVVFMLVFWRWELGIILVLCSTSFIVYYDVLPTLSLYHFIPEIPVLEHLRLTLGQGLMLFLLAAFCLSGEIGTARRRLATPVAATVLLFLLAMLVVSMVGLAFRGVGLRMMVETSRSYWFYLMFFVGALCLRSRRELRLLLQACFCMSLIVAVLMYAQFFAGERAKFFLGNSIRVESFGGFAGRILPPGTELIWTTVPFVVSRIPLCSPRGARGLYLALFLLLGGLLLTFTRSIWLGVLLSMAIMAVLGRGAIRLGVARIFLAMVVSVALLLLLLSIVSTERENYMTPYIKRFTSIFKAESYAEGSSAGARFMEISAAWPKIVEHPWLGIGVGGVYRYEEDWDEIWQSHYWRPVSYIHNAYVLLLTQGGVLALGTCLTMFVTFFVRARRVYHTLQSPEDRSIVIACIGSTASILLASVMQPSLWYPPAVPCLALMLGIVEAVRYFSERDAEAAVVWDSSR
ncbi:MAG TPA: O-antigen ligase family protein [Candidatus Krumholzibacteria bacterium]|jgi:O-antigen ligase|nr:O-antigen ligase family protein [Candidatus Krumholzibacteria bacterium]